MPTTDFRHWAQFSPFDPEEGTVVRQPPGEGAGYWVGAPSATVDADNQTTYLVYRLRRPRGVEPDRGAESRIAKSDDGIEFEDIWTGHKKTLNTTSIERCTMARLPNGRWGLFVSFVDPSDGRWRIDLTQADDPSQFDFSSRTTVLTAAQVGVEGVKDPFLFRVAGLYQMIVSYATADSTSSANEMHGTSDAYNTGLIKSRTGLATSEDGITWQWEGDLLSGPETGWDRYCTRINTVWQEGNVWLALYDGSADVSENYEERCGLAYSFDLRHFHRVTRQEPLFENPHATGAIRYFDVVRRSDATDFYYEAARADGSHDLRVFRHPTV